MVCNRATANRWRRPPTTALDGCAQTCACAQCKALHNANQLEDRAQPPGCSRSVHTIYVFHGRAKFNVKSLSDTVFSRADRVHRARDGVILKQSLNLCK